MTINVDWMQAPSGQPVINYTAQQFRQLIDALTTEGVVAKANGDFRVIPTPGGANLHVTVGTGAAFVDGDDQSAQGTYSATNDAPVDVGPFAAAPVSGARIDLVVLKIHDPQAGGSAGTSGVEIVQGVAGTSGGAAAPALPPSAIPLAEVRLNASDLSIQTGNITDRRVQAASPEAGGLPIGAISQWLGAVAPTGWLILDGSNVSRTTYPDLFALWGVTYGVGDGSTTFGLPDARTKVLAGRMAGDATFGGSLGSTIGAPTITLSTAQMPSHNHAGSTVTGGAHNHTFDAAINSVNNGGPYMGTNVAGVNGTYQVNQEPSGTGHAHNLTIAAQGAASPTPVVQPSLLVNHIVKAL